MPRRWQRGSLRRGFASMGNRGARVGRTLETSTVDMSVTVGSVELESPVMCASGTAGHGAELGDYFELSRAGAVVVKSLLHEPWMGNPAPRLHPTDSGMINSIGLQGPGVQGWIDRYLDDMVAAKAKIVVSIWGRSIEEFAKAAQMLAPVAGHLVAVEANVSCPNVEDRDRMFAHSANATREAVEAATVAQVPVWAKLSPNILDLVPIADAAQRGGAEAVTVANTLIDR